MLSKRDNHIGMLIYCNDTIKSKEKRGRKGIAAVGVAGLAGIIVTTIISMGFMAQSATMSDPVFFQSVIIVLNAVIVVGVIVGTARWIYRKL
jgi:hypothetical protein